MEGFIIFSMLVILGFIVLCIYFIYKQIEFVVVSVNLYKKMVKQQSAMAEILLDIRDQTKNFNKTESSIKSDNKSEIDSSSTKSAIYDNEDDVNDDDEILEFCYHCGYELKKKVKTCPNCGKKL